MEAGARSGSTRVSGRRRLRSQKRTRTLRSRPPTQSPMAGIHSPAPQWSLMGWGERAIRAVVQMVDDPGMSGQVHDRVRAASACPSTTPTSRPSSQCHSQRSGHTLSRASTIGCPGPRPHLRARRRPGLNRRNPPPRSPPRNWDPTAPTVHEPDRYEHPLMSLIGVAHERAHAKERTTRRSLGGPALPTM